MNIPLNEIINKLKTGIMIEDVGIEVKKRIEIITKMYIIEGFSDKGTTNIGLAKECVSFKDGFMYIQYALKEIITKVTIITCYTNIDIENSYNSNDLVYDQLVENGILDYVLNKIDCNDLNLFYSLLENNIEQLVKIHNNPLSFINKWILELLDKIPDEKEMYKIIDKIKNINPKKINELKEMVKKISN